MCLLRDCRRGVSSGHTSTVYSVRWKFTLIDCLLWPQPIAPAHCLKWSMDGTKINFYRLHSFMSACNNKLFPPVQIKEKKKTTANSMLGSLKFLFKIKWWLFKWLNRNSIKNGSIINLKSLQRRDLVEKGTEVGMMSALEWLERCAMTKLQRLSLMLHVPLHNYETEPSVSGFLLHRFSR